MMFYMLIIFKRNMVYVYFGMVVWLVYVLGLYREEMLRDVIFMLGEMKVRWNLWKILFILDWFLVVILGRFIVILGYDCLMNIFLDDDVVNFMEIIGEFDLVYVKSLYVCVEICWIIGDMLRVFFLCKIFIMKV